MTNDDDKDIVVDGDGMDDKMIMMISLYGRLDLKNIYILQIHTKNFRLKAMKECVKTSFRRNCIRI